MAQVPEEFVLRAGASHETKAGIVFSLVEGGHKHGSGGLTSGQWTLRFAKQAREGELAFAVTEPEDWYGEGHAFGVLFRLMGDAPGGGVRLVLQPVTSSRPRAPGRPDDCGKLARGKAVAKALPAGVSLAQGASVREGTGSCIFSPLDGSAVVVVGRYSGDVLHVRRLETAGEPALK
jgi:hypothetical protein